MLSPEWTLVFGLAAAWFVSMLMNRGAFDSHYFLAALAGALLFPFVAACCFRSWLPPSHNTPSLVRWAPRPSPVCSRDAPAHSLPVCCSTPQNACRGVEAISA
jgi:hypothetical protein